MNAGGCMYKSSDYYDEFQNELSDKLNNLKSSIIGQINNLEEWLEKILSYNDHRLRYIDMRIREATREKNKELYDEMKQLKLKTLSKHDIKKINTIINQLNVIKRILNEWR